jgi:RNA polymerase sigma factor (sigma-70 family)
VRRHQGVAVRTAYLVTGIAAEAEDVAQSAFLKAYLALGRFRQGAPFRPWLLRIVVNEAKNRRRWSARHPELELTEAHERLTAASPSPEEEAEAAERRRRLLGAVNGLRRGDREVIAYRYFLDLSEAEMAEVMDVAPGTVKSRLSRALLRLREALGSGGTEALEATGE